MNITFNLTDIKEVDLDTQRVTFGLALLATWKDSRISCALCYSATQVTTYHCSSMFKIELTLLDFFIVKDLTLVPRVIVTK